MKNTNSRRDFLKKVAIGSAAAMSPRTLFSANKTKNDFPMVDYHVHLTRNFTIEEALALAEERNMKFGIVEHPGAYYAIKTDKDLGGYIKNLRKHPVYVGLQPIFRNWAKDFSKELVNQLDYVLMDADTVPLGDGHFLRIWRHDNYIEDVDKFMGIYMEHITDILENEQLNIFARPTYLPVNFGRYYNKIWTKDRMMKIIEPAKRRGIAMEISTPMHVPSKEFILLAKSEGIKFTFGTNARNTDAGKCHYGIKMMKECGLTKDDMYSLS